MGTPVIVASIVLVAMSASATAAQDQLQTASSPRSQAASTQAFLSHRYSEQAERKGNIADQANLRDLNGIVRAASVILPSPSFADDRTQLAALRDSFLVDVAQNLALRGFKAGDLRRDPVAAQKLIGAVAGKIRGTATVKDELVLADVVAIGTVQATVPELRGDGLHSTVKIAVEQAFRGPVKSGDTINLRRISGPTNDGTSIKVTSEDTVPPGAKVALIGSHELYLNAHAGRGARCDSCVVEEVPLFLVSGSMLVPTGGYSRSAPVSILSSAAQ